MNKLIEHIKSLSFIIIIVLSVMSVIIYQSNKKKNIAKLIATGKQSVAYIYETTGSGRNSSPDAWYYFYTDGNLIKDYCNAPENIYSLNKFFIVYYMPDEPKNSILDFSREIPSDSVANFFSEGKNPFRFLIGK
jgi:hypothetical protein